MYTVLEVRRNERKKERQTEFYPLPIRMFFFFFFFFVLFFDIIMIRTEVLLLLTG